MCYFYIKAVTCKWSENPSFLASLNKWDLKIKALNPVGTNIVYNRKLPPLFWRECRQIRADTIVEQTHYPMSTKNCKNFSKETPLETRVDPPSQKWEIGANYYRRRERFSRSWRRGINKEVNSLLEFHTFITATFAQCISVRT